MIQFVQKLVGIIVNKNANFLVQNIFINTYCNIF
jgi:hypothetical protein